MTNNLGCARGERTTKPTLQVDDLQHKCLVLIQISTALPFCIGPFATPSSLFCSIQPLPNFSHLPMLQKEIQFFPFHHPEIQIFLQVKQWFTWTSSNLMYCIQWLEMWASLCWLGACIVEPLVEHITTPCWLLLQFSKPIPPWHSTNCISQFLCSFICDLTNFPYFKAFVYFLSLSFSLNPMSGWSIQHFRSLVVSFFVIK